MAVVYLITTTSSDSGGSPSEEPEQTSPAPTGFDRKELA
jgi:hypothetical protein